MRESLRNLANMTRFFLSWRFGEFLAWQKSVRQVNAGQATEIFQSTLDLMSFIAQEAQRNPGFEQAWEDWVRQRYELEEQEKEAGA